MSKKSKKAEVNWLAIETEYRTSLASMRELSRKYDVPESTIRGRKSKFKWSKDLTKRVSKAVKDKQIRLVGDEILSDDDDEAIVNKAAEEKIGILRGHRKKLVRLGGLYESLVANLEGQLNRGRVTFMVKSKPVEIDIPLDYVGKVVSNAATVLKTIVDLERENYRLNDEEDDKGTYDDQLVALFAQFKDAEKAEAEAESE